MDVCAQRPSLPYSLLYSRCDIYQFLFLSSCSRPFFHGRLWLESNPTSMPQWKNSSSIPQRHAHTFRFRTIIRAPCCAMENPDGYLEKDKIVFPVFYWVSLMHR